MLSWHLGKNSRLPITRTSKGNRKRFGVIGSSSYRELNTNDSRRGRDASSMHTALQGTQEIYWHFEEVELDRPIFCNAKKYRIHGCLKMFWTTVLRSFWVVTYWQTWFELSRVKLYRKIHEGKRKLLRVSGRFELSRVRVTEVKIACS